MAPLRRRLSNFSGQPRSCWTGNPSAPWRVGFVRVDRAVTAGICGLEFRPLIAMEPNGTTRAYLSVPCAHLFRGLGRRILSGVEAPARSGDILMMFWMLARITNHEKIGRGVDCLRRGLLPLIDSRLRPEDRANWQIRPVRGTIWKSTALDVKDCLEILNKFWDDRFRSPELGRGERAWVNNSSTRSGTRTPIEHLRTTLQTTTPGEHSILLNACSQPSDLPKPKTCESSG